MSGSRESLGNMIGMAGSAVVFPLVWIFGLGFPMNVVLPALVFGCAGVVSWFEGFRYAGIGYLFVVLAFGVVPVVAQASAIAFAAFFGFALVGCGFVLYEGVVRSEKQNAERNGFTG